MYPVSQGFAQQVKALERRTYGRVQIDYTDPFLDQSIIASANEEAGSGEGQRDGVYGAFRAPSRQSVLPDEPIESAKPGTCVAPVGTVIVDPLKSVPIG